MKPVHAFWTSFIGMALAASILVPSPAGEPRAKSSREPQLLLDVSGRAINTLVQRRVDRTEPVEEEILDTPVHVMSRTVATVSAQLVPDLHHAAVDVVLQGCVYSRSVATRPHVLIYSIGESPLEVRQRVVVDRVGMRSFCGPVHAESHTSLVDITSRAEPDYTAIRFAHKFYEKSKRKAEAEAAYKTGLRASNQMYEELAPKLSAASQQVGKGLAKIKAAGLTLEALDFRTTSSHVQARLRIASGRGQSTPAPALADDADVGVRIHQSLINETAESALGGKTIQLTELQKFYDDVTLGLLGDPRKDEEQRDTLKKLQKLLADLGTVPTAIALSKKDPVAVVFAEQGFTVEIQVASIRQNGKNYAGMRVRGAYRLENTKAGVQAVRQGPVRFLPLMEIAEKKLEAQPAAFLLLRELLFAEIMKPRLALESAPVANALPNLRLMLPHVSADQGWLTVAWTLKDASR